MSNKNYSSFAIGAGAGALFQILCLFYPAVVIGWHIGFMSVTVSDTSTLSSREDFIKGYEAMNFTDQEKKEWAGEDPNKEYDRYISTFKDMTTEDWKEFNNNADVRVTRFGWGLLTFIISAFIIIILRVCRVWIILVPLYLITFLPFVILCYWISYCNFPFPGFSFCDIYHWPF